MDNYFKQHRLIIILFVLSFFVFLYFAIISERGAFGDVPCEFFRELINIDNGDVSVWLFPKDLVARFFSYKLSLVFFYFLYNNFHKVSDLLALYTFSVLFVPFIILFLNFIVAYRTKRYDIAVLTFFYYCFFEIPYISWIERESHVAVLMQFILLSYFLSKEKLKKFDIFFILPLIFLFLFESFENMAVIGFIFLIFGILYFIRNPLDNKSKLVYGLISFLISIYILIKTYIATSCSDCGGMSFSVAFSNWMHNIKMLIDSTFTSCMIISLFGIILCFSLIFFKRNLSKKDFLWGIPLVCFVLYILYVFTNFVPDPNKESNLFIYCLIIMPLIYFFYIIFDYFNIKPNNIYCENVFIIVCIVGILQFLWQINSSVYSMQYVEKIKSFLNTSEKPINIIHFEESEIGYTYDSNCCTTFRSLVLSDNYIIKKVLYSDPEHRDYSDLDKNFYKNFYDKNKNILYIVNIPMKPTGRYWDLTDMLDHINEYNQ